MSSAGRNQVGLLERCFVVGVLVLMTNAFISLLVTEIGNQETLISAEGNRFFQIIAIVAYLIITALIVPRIKSFLRLCLKNKLLLLLLAMTFFSVLWSDIPLLTLQRATALLLTTMFAIYIVMRFTPEEFLQLLAWTMGILVISSFFFAILLPDFGTHTSGKFAGLWRGVFPQKQVLGKIMSLGALIFLIREGQRRSHFIQNWTWFGLCLFLVVMSGSRTACLVMAVVLIHLMLLSRLRKLDLLQFTIITMVGVLFAGVVLTWIATNFQAVTEFMGKNVTLSGRTQIWSIAASYGLKNPWLGYGYRSFWVGRDGKYSEEICEILGYMCPHGHNSLLDIWLEIGIIGVILFLATYIIGFWYTLQRIRGSVDTIGLWYISFLIYILLMSGLSSTVAMAQNNITWVVYVATLYYARMPFFKTPSNYQPLFSPCSQSDSKKDEGL